MYRTEWAWGMWRGRKFWYGGWLGSECVGVRIHRERCGSMHMLKGEVGIPGCSNVYIVPQGGRGDMGVVGYRDTPSR